MQELQHSKSSSSPSWTPRPSRCQSRPISHNLSCHSENVWGKPFKAWRPGGHSRWQKPDSLRVQACPGKPNSFQWFWTPPALPPKKAPDDPLSSRLPSRWTSGKYFESSNLDEAPGGTWRHIGIPHGTMTVRTTPNLEKYVGDCRCKQD